MQRIFSLINRMNQDNKLIALALVALVIAMFGAGVTYFSIANLTTKISGLASSTGEANLTVVSSANINFTTASINWGTGEVDGGSDYAILNTAAGTVTGGNWTAVNGGFIVENIGNVNITLDLQAGKTAAQFLGGTSPGYMWNVSNSESGSCVNMTYLEPYVGNVSGFGVFADTSTSVTRICDFFDFIDSRDTIEIDLNLSVPVNSLKGALSDVITATATAA